MTMTPEFDRLRLTLRLRRTPVFHFHHGGVVQGMLRAAVGTHELPEGLIPFACESGRIHFEEGHEYRIGITLCGSARDLRKALVEGVTRVGGTPPARGPLPALGGNFDLVSAEELPAPDLNRELATVRGNDSVTLRFLSPFRLERPAELKVAGAAYINGDCFPVDHFLLRLWQRLFRLQAGRYPSAAERVAVPPDAASVIARAISLTWVDVPVKGIDTARRPKGYTLGGVVGRVPLAAVPDSWLYPLILGQYLHAGANTHYGFGRYAIEECWSPAGDPLRPSRSYRDALSDPRLLQRALEHVQQHSEAAGVDGVSPDTPSSDLARLPETLARDLDASQYAPSPLLGILGTKSDGGIRPLTIPTVADRVVQRASVELMAPAIDTLLEDCSFAYRKGFSRAGAARAIQRAYEEGYRFVLDADITSFFDAVPWDRLFDKLEALFPFDAIVSLLRGWTTAPVIFDGRSIRRDRGLPQGTAVSPLLANLYLDELDEELGEEYRLVRYADDFVVLCRDLDEARQARDDARAALQRLGLSLHEAKTDIRSMDAGFTYLGYLFCRSTVVEQQTEKHEGTAVLAELPRHSWLASVPLDRVRALASGGAVRADRATESAVVPLASQEMIAIPDRRPLYAITTGTSLRIENDRIAVQTPEGERVEVPVRLLSHLVCARGVRVTMPLLLRLNEAGVPVFFCKSDGELFASFHPHAPDWSLWRLQAEASAREELRVAFAREIVAAKLHNAAALVVRFSLGDGTAADGLRELERSCWNKTEIESLLGLEGKGAALYFGALAGSLQSEWGFTARRKRPAPDPVNAMLSYGYTMLYQHIGTAVIAEGLHPRVGLYHKEKGAYHALACDLQEELRFLVDSLVWALISRRQVKPSDFLPARERSTVLLERSFRRRFIDAFQRRLLDPFTPDGEREPLSYLEFIARQARQVRALVTGSAVRYRPLRVHS